MNNYLKCAALGIASLSIFSTMGCRKNRDKAPEQMEISSFLPAEGSAGDTITISGKKFAADKAGNSVMINGRNVEIYQASATELKIIISEQITTGKIKVKAGVDSAITGSSFTVTPAQVSLTNFVPDHGEWGTVVTVNGRKILSDAKIYFDNIEVREFEPGRTLNTVAFKIPAGTKSNKIRIVQNQQHKEFPATFTVTNTWERINANTPGFTMNGAVSYVYNGSIYMGLGAAGATDQQEFYRFDASDKKWHHAFHAPGSGQHASIVEYNGKIYVGNGVLTNGKNQTIWSEFDPSTPANWNSMLEWDFPAGNTGNITFVLNGKIYSGFGHAGSMLYRWDRTSADPISWKWVEPKDYSSPALCLYYASRFIIGNDLYVGAGFNACGSYLGVKYFKLNPETGEHTEIATFPENVTFTTAFSKDGKGYVITENGGFYEYDPVENTWTTKPGTGLASRHSAVIDGKLYTWTKDGEMARFVPNY